MVPLSPRAHCLADVIITQRVHVCTMRRTLPVWASGGQSSLYAVCRAPRQKHCWAVKHSVTKTTCSWVVDRQTQTASAAPHQEFVPYHRGLWGLLFWLQSNTLLRHDAFYTYLETQIGTRLLSDNNTFRRILFGLKWTCPDTYHYTNHYTWFHILDRSCRFQLFCGLHLPMWDIKYKCQPPTNGPQLKRTFHFISFLTNNQLFEHMFMNE